MEGVLKVLVLVLVVGFFFPLWFLFSSGVPAAERDIKDWAREISCRCFFLLFSCVGLGLAWVARVSVHKSDCVSVYVSLVTTWELPVFRGFRVDEVYG